MDRRLIGPARGVTLLELLIAIFLFATIAIGFYSIDLFSRNQVLSAQNQAQVQNEASIALEHIAKEVKRAIGSTVLSGENPVDLTAIGGNTALRVYVDVAADGISAGDGKWGTAGADRWRAYRFRGAGAPASERYQLWYYPNYVNPSSSYEVIARNISAFVPTTTGNYVSVSITACWDPTASSYACGTIQNPQVVMAANIEMPAVSLK